MTHTHINTVAIKLKGPPGRYSRAVAINFNSHKYKTDKHVARLRLMSQGKLPICVCQYEYMCVNSTVPKLL